jgi:iron-sulfur cluster assembly protein
MIQISETAAKKIKSLMAKQGITEGGLRVGVKGGGCSGLSYTNGTTLDYDTELLTKGFVFHNPNAKATCGCGSSFGA